MARKSTAWSLVGGVMGYSILVLGAISILIPFIDMFLEALKNESEILARPPVFISKNPNWGIYVEVFRSYPLLLYFKNSIIISSAITLLVVITSAMAGFALSKYKFRGRDFIFRTVLIAQMFPMFLFLIPNYWLMKHWPLAGGNTILGLGGTGLLRSYGSLVLPFAVSWWGVFMMRQFMISLPEDLLDAARIDGCSEYRIFYQIILPMVKAALATLGIFTFMGAWNEYVWTAIITSAAPHMRTIPVGTHLLRDAFDPIRGQSQMRAMLALGSVPILILFLSLQKYYVKGIAMTGLKG